MITATIDSSGLRAKLEALSAAMKSQTVALNIGGQLLIALIGRRATSGKGLAGPMPSYSPQYAKWRQRKGFQTSHRDLNVSGQMQGAMTILSNDGRNITVGFPEGFQRDKADWNQQIAAWFGAISSERSQVMDVIRKSLAIK
jgi:hypothetical protein